MSFVHLHNHSCYSLLDGLSQPKDMLQKAIDLKQPKIAITDHGGMWGAYTFCKLAEGTNIKPIIGNELYYCTSHRGTKQRQNYHLVALVTNAIGYKNLCILTAKSYAEGFYYKPRIDSELLEKYNEGIIFLSACMAGWPARLVLEDKTTDAYNVAKWFKERLGDRYFLEIQDTGIHGQIKINKEFTKISKQLGIGLVATNDTHFCDKEDKVIQEFLTKITHDLHGDPYKENYIRSTEEMQFVFRDLPEACNNTLKIAERCDFTFPKQYYLPTYKMTDDEITKYKTSIGLLDGLVQEGLAKFYNNSQRAIEQVQFELDVIRRMGFNDYILIVWDIVNWCRKNKIAVGPGRGSAAGSVICYCIGITKVEPFRFGLYFERFLNPDRISLPDIDLDFDCNRRDDVIQYIKQRYGDDHTSQIITFSELRSRAALKECGRALSFPVHEVNALTQKVRSIFGKPQTLEEAFENPDTRDLSLYESLHRPEIRKLYDVAKQIENLPRHHGVHAAGIVISDIPIMERVPLQVDRKNSNVFLTQFAKEQIDDLGLLKMDILGLATLTIIDKALALIKQRHNIEIDIDTIPQDDGWVYNFISSGKTRGVFQLDKPPMARFLRILKPRCIDDIIAAGALHRPGPMGEGMDMIFAKRKNGELDIMYEHPDLEPILKNTLGVITYQEQIMTMLRKLCGWSMSEADQARKAIGKKKKEDLDKIAPKFKADGLKNGYTQEVLDRIWSLIQTFAAYGFNLCIDGETKLYRQSNQHGFNPTVAEMYHTLHNKEYVKTYNCKSLHDKYKRSGYGKCLSLDKDYRIYQNKIINITAMGVQKVFKVITQDGHIIICTANHKFPTTNGEKLLSECTVGTLLFCLDKYEKTLNNYNLYDTPINNWPIKGQMGFQKRENGHSVILEAKKLEYRNMQKPCEYCGTNFHSTFEIHHKDKDRTNNTLDNLTWVCNSCHKKLDYQLGRTKQYGKGMLSKTTSIVSIEPYGEKEVYDIEVEGPNHNFLIDNGLVVSNSHAACYGLIGYQTAWLKTYYTIEYIVALMSVEFSKTDELAAYCREAGELGIKVLAPDIHESDVFPKIVDNQTIRFGLASVKGVGIQAAQAIVEARGSSKFGSILDLCLRAPTINRRTLEPLVKCGALNSICGHPAAGWDELEETSEAAGQIAKESKDGFKPIFDDEIPMIAKVSKEVARWDEMTCLRNESEALGFYLTKYPLEQFEAELRKRNNYYDLEELLDPEHEDVKDMLTSGFVQECTLSISKKKNKFFKVKLEGRTGSILCLIFTPDVNINEGDAVLVGGSFKSDDPPLILARSCEQLKIG